MIQYHQMLTHVMNNGSSREDRTGTGTLSVFGYQNRYDLSKGFPLVTTKRVHWKSVVHELLWFLSGDTNVKYLNDNGVTIWNEWADQHGYLGPIYGKQWRSWLGVDVNGYMTETDQIADAIWRIKNDPNSRRIIVSGWNVAQVEGMALPPCHTMFQFYVDGGRLSCQLYQRSADAFLGVPFNIASYALLTHMVAQVTGLKVGEFVHTFGDLHIYKNHQAQVMELLTREPRPLPTLLLNQEVTDIDSFKFEDIQLAGYDPWPAIKAPVAV